MPSPHTAQQILTTLPRQAQGESLDRVQIIDDSVLSGHAIDNALDWLGKRRSDATIVFVSSSTDATSVGGIEVTGVDGMRLLEAVAATWDAAAVIRRSTETVAGRSVWVLAERGGAWAVLYRREFTVYIVTGNDMRVIEGFVAALP